MGEEVSDPKNSEAVSDSAIPWAEATVQDVVDFDFDALPEVVEAAHSQTLSEICSAASRAADRTAAERRVLRFVGGLLSMMLEASSADEPYRPMVVWADGRRSAAFEDFRSCVDVLVAITKKFTNACVVARAADVAWMIDRKQHKLATVAILTYCRLFDDVVTARRGDPDVDQFENEVFGVAILRRCAVILNLRSVSSDAPEFAAVGARILAARDVALHSADVQQYIDLTELAVSCELFAPISAAKDIEAAIDRVSTVTDGHLIADALSAAARLYARGKDSDRTNAAKRRISDTYVAMADLHGGSAMIASSHIASAISALAGVPNSKERRRELRHRLLDVQSGIADEMSVFSRAIDIDDVRAVVADEVTRKNFYEALFMLAIMRQPADPAVAREEAAQVAKKHPLSSMFAASHHDREGKIRHVTPSANLGELSNLDAQIARHHSIKRNVDVGILEVVRAHLSRNYSIAPELLLPIVSASPFVPEALVYTFSNGFSKFLRGDAVAALYVLTSLVEAGVRECLKAAGYDVTTFDEVNRTQKDKSISALYTSQRADMIDVFGAALVFEIEQVFLSPVGPAFRHGVAHALLSDGDAFTPDAFYACWLVLHLCFAPLYPHRYRIGLPGMEHKEN